MVDYNHGQGHRRPERRHGRVGTRDGVKLGPTDRVGNPFETMEFSDGLNELFFGGQYRWIYERRTPYVGFGVAPCSAAITDTACVAF